MTDNLSLDFPAPPGLNLSRPAGLDVALARFQSLRNQPESVIRAIHYRPASEGEYAEVPPEVHASLRDALARHGVQRLYSHQAEAFRVVAEGKNVVVVTPTASGKTLCYNLPVLNRLVEDPGARAMYLFPTKALAEDQFHELQRSHRRDGFGPPCVHL